jgi:hypothetical protein
MADFEKRYGRLYAAAQKLHMKYHAIIGKTETVWKPDGEEVKQYKSDFAADILAAINDELDRAKGDEQYDRIYESVMRLHKAYYTLGDDDEQNAELIKQHDKYKSPFAKAMLFAMLGEVERNDIR